MTTKPAGGSRKPEAPSAPERRTSERSEQGRSAGADGASPTNPSARDVEIVAHPTRRTFSAEYKLKILRDAEAARETGGIGALLRREGLYASHLITWRRQREAGELSAPAPKRRGPKPNPDTALARDCERLRRENSRLTAQLAQAQTIIEIQKKVAAMLGTPLKGGGSDGETS